MGLSITKSLFPHLPETLKTCDSIFAQTLYVLKTLAFILVRKVVLRYRQSYNILRNCYQQLESVAVQESAGLSHPLRGFDRNQYILPIEKGAIKAPISIGGGHGTRTRLLRQLEPLEILSYSDWQK